MCRMYSGDVSVRRGANDGLVMHHSKDAMSDFGLYFLTSFSWASSNQDFMI